MLLTYSFTLAPNLSSLAALMDKMEEDNSGARFSPRKSKNCTSHCCVYGCSSRAQHDATLRFHAFPSYGNNSIRRYRDFHEQTQKYTRLRTWLTNLRMSYKDLYPTSSVCSLHFKREDYILADVPSLNRRLLRTGAVPTCNLPTLEQSEEGKAAMEAARLQKQEEKLQNEKKKHQQQQEKLQNIQKKIEKMTMKNKEEDQVVINQEPQDPISIDDGLATTEELATNPYNPPVKKYQQKKKGSISAHPSDPLALGDETENVAAVLGKQNDARRKRKTIKKNPKKPKYFEVTLKEEHEEMISIDNGLPMTEQLATTLNNPAAGKYKKKKKKKGTTHPPSSDQLIQRGEVEVSGKQNNAKRKAKTIKKNPKKQKYLEVVVKVKEMISIVNGLPMAEELAANSDNPVKKYKTKKKKSSTALPSFDPLSQAVEAENAAATVLGKQDNVGRKAKTNERNSKKQNYLKGAVNKEHEEMILDKVGLVPLVHIASVGTQMKPGEIGMRLSDLLITDRELSTITGLPNFEILRRIVEAVKMVYPEKRIRTNLDTREKVIMTLMKLKHDVSYMVLSSLFKCTRIAQCKNIVYNMLTKMSNVLKHAIEFPTMEEISVDLPDGFQDFRDVRVVLDCMEITVQRPSNLCCQMAVFTHYNNYTVKLMIGFTPGGLISLVSKAYGGRSSDNSIFEQSKIAERLGRDEAVMTSGGCMVDNICSQYRIKLISPKFCTGESFQNEKIAKALVHRDTAIQRLKVYTVLSSRMPISLIKKCEDILIIAAAIVNLSIQQYFR